MRLLNVERALQFPRDWNNPAWEKLWIYQLHYFDDLRTACVEPADPADAALVVRWIKENPPWKGSGWEPYPLSLRIVNWIRWLIGTKHDDAYVVASLATQVRHLSRQLEYHLLGNHLFANVKALIFAATFFQGEEADQWMAIALRLLDREIDEQILPDGAHFELSPMYHALILEDLLDLLALEQCAQLQSLRKRSVRWRPAIGRMLSWLDRVTHPDGRIAFFNDAVFGASAEPVELRTYAKRLGVQQAERAHEPSSGHYRLQRGPCSVILDAAPVGPDHLPGHAHADTLSFELSWGMQRVVCNTGCSRYGVSAERLWERSTAAHATVEIDDTSSSEVWSGFRVAKRARPIRLRVSGNEIECAHDGYTRLPGSPIHLRLLSLASDGTMLVTDIVEGTGCHRVTARFPIHPDVEVVRKTVSAFRLRLPSGVNLCLRRVDGGNLQERSGKWCPEFGMETKRPVLAWQHDGQLPIKIEVQIEADT